MINELSILWQKLQHRIQIWHTKLQIYSSIIMLVTLFLLGIILPSTAAKVTIKSPDSSLNNTSNLVEQGRRLYQTGQFSDAIRILQQAAKNYAANGDKLRQAMTLRNLSLASQELGLWTEAQEAITQSLKLLENLENSPEQSQIMAQTLDAQGRWQLKRGQTQEAIQTWQRAADIYSQMGEKVKFIRNRINSAQALQILGFYRQAEKILTNVRQQLESQAESPLKATALRSLGDVLQVIGDLKQSTQVLQSSLKIAVSLQSNQQIVEALISLANIARIQGDTETAFSYYQQALNVSIPNFSICTRWCFT